MPCHVISPMPIPLASPHQLNNLTARYLKKEFDSKYGPTWHAVVGRNFGSWVVHQSRTFIYFYVGQVAVLLFKMG